MTLEVRAAGSDDIADLIAADPYAQINAGRRAQIAEWIEAGHCFVAERDGHIIGYSVVVKEFFDSFFIKLVAVAEAERRDTALNRRGKWKLWESGLGPGIGYRIHQTIAFLPRRSTALAASIQTWSTEAGEKWTGRRDLLRRSCCASSTARYAFSRKLASV